MKCLNAQNKIPEYLEDMLSEEVRGELRTHLKSCPVCQAHAVRLGSLAGDLKQLARVPVPFDLERAVTEEFSREAPAGADSIPFKIIGVLVLAAILIFGFYQMAHQGKTPRKEKKSAQENPIEDSQAAAILEKLKETEAALAKRSGEAGGRALNRRVVSSLEPFHWRLQFPNAAERDFFSSKIKALNLREGFDTEYLWVFSMDQDLLGKLLKTIEESSARIAEGPKVDLKVLPQSQAPLRISVLMEAEDSREVLLWNQLRFLRQDSYLFARGLHEEGFNFLYESPHLILLRATPAQYKKLTLEIRSRLGVQIIKGNEAEFSKKTPPEVFPVILFFQEG